MHRASSICLLRVGIRMIQHKDKINLFNLVKADAEISHTDVTKSRQRGLYPFTAACAQDLGFQALPARLFSVIRDRSV